MLSQHLQQKYYQALLQKDKNYDGTFYVGVTTTGVFCRPTCPARKPKYEHCEFFRTAQEALLASFRPCQRCQPLSHPDHVSPLIQKLVAAVEANPEQHWKDHHVAKLGFDPSTARRQFQKRFGMTFVAYARARRMGIAMKEIRKGKPIIQAQLTAGFESGSGFRDAFSKIMREAPAHRKNQLPLLRKATRAVANANGANQLAIIIPCHRIINSNSALGGYGGGVARKEWLLQHEAKFCV